MTVPPLAIVRFSSTCPWETAAGETPSHCSDLEPNSRLSTRWNTLGAGEGHRSCWPLEMLLSKRHQKFDHSFYATCFWIGQALQGAISSMDRASNTKTNKAIHGNHIFNSLGIGRTPICTENDGRKYNFQINVFHLRASDNSVVVTTNSSCIPSMKNLGSKSEEFFICISTKVSQLWQILRGS